MLVLSGSSGWRTCSSLLSIHLNNDSSAAVNKSVIVGTSSAQYPSPRSSDHWQWAQPTSETGSGRQATSPAVHRKLFL